MNFEKIELLLESTDKANIELALTILSGFTFEEADIKWLWQYYNRLQNNEKANRPKYNLSQILTGTIISKPTKASRILTLLLEKTNKKEKNRIYESFINNKKITLPRLEFTDFPASLFYYSDLETIVWRHGNLAILPATLLQLPNLQYLDLRYQPLIQIDEKIIEHPSLKEIWISNALIVTENIADSANFDILIEAAY
jgi:Leucine-rich repeat (LRR) protein